MTQGKPVRAAVWLIVVVIQLLLVAGCQQNLRRYSEVIGTILELGMVDPNAKTITLRVIDPQTNQPIGNVPIHILSKTRPVTVLTDINGWAQIPVDPIYLNEDPWIKHNAGRKVTVTAKFTASIKSGDTAQRYVDVQDLRRLDADHASVLFPDGTSARAEQVLQSLAKQHRTVRNVTGLSAIPWTVVLLAEKQEGISYVVAQRVGLFNAWAYSLAEIDNGRFARTNTHEWTESTIGERLNLHDADPHGRNRIWIDGLAEYAAFKVAGPEPDAAAVLRAMIENGRQHVDLVSLFRSIRIRIDPHRESLFDFVKKNGFAPGYPLSFVFWHDLCQAHGDDLPRRFLARIAEQQNREFEACLDILQELTGERGLKRRLRKAGLAHALEVFESLEPAPTPNSPAK